MSKNSTKQNLQALTEWMLWKKVLKKNAKGRLELVNQKIKKFRK